MELSVAPRAADSLAARRVMRADAEVLVVRVGAAVLAKASQAHDVGVAATRGQGAACAKSDDSELHAHALGKAMLCRFAGVDLRVWIRVCGAEVDDILDVLGCLA